MQVLIPLTVVIVLIGVGVHSKSVHNKQINGKSDSLTPKQMRQLRKLLRLHGTNRNKMVENEEGYSYSKSPKNLMEPSTFSADNSPQISISTNDKIIFANSMDFRDIGEFDNAGVKKQNRRRRLHKVRTARSVPFKAKGPMLSTSFRKIDRDPDQQVTKDDAHVEMGVQDLINSEKTAGNNDGGSTSNMATVSESIATPSTNGGVTKVEINLSFGCLFFCE